MKYLEEKLYLATVLTYRGIKKIQSLATLEQTKMRTGKHINASTLGTKKNRRKKNREQPYGKAVSNVKFWQDVRVLKDNIINYDLSFINEYKNEAFSLFKSHTHNLTLKHSGVNEDGHDIYMVLDERERKLFDKK